ncbi:MAG: malate dehydrogenase [Candidatus Omnitrophica bacterium]|jgi:malate dehydrogenase|nr:malate dehydrogenase [Candidatus Omnitrophota bacterium]
MKISIIGAGNVGGTAALRLAQENIGDIFLFDIAENLARAKAYDLADARQALGMDYHVTGTSDFEQLKNSDIVVITAGLARKPGMTREDLASKNASILKQVCHNIRQYCQRAVVVVVTNPLDLMTRVCINSLNFKKTSVLGMGLTLDASRFANLIAEQFNVPVSKVVPCVIGSHGEGMMPLARFTFVNGTCLKQLLPEEEVNQLISRTIGRGAEIVSLYGTGSAYYAPSAAIAELVKAIAQDKRCVLGVSCYLNGQYGVKDVCAGLPCVIGKNGIEEIVQLDLDQNEKESFLKACQGIKEQFSRIQ